MLLSPRSHLNSLLHISYQRLLQTIGVLEAQRTQAILDLETLACHQRRALSDPISFVEQLQKQVKKKKKTATQEKVCFFFVLTFVQTHDQR